MTSCQPGGLTTILPSGIPIDLVISRRPGGLTTTLPSDIPIDLVISQLLYQLLYQATYQLTWRSRVDLAASRLLIQATTNQPGGRTITLSITLPSDIHMASIFQRFFLSASAYRFILGMRCLRQKSTMYALSKLFPGQVDKAAVRVAASASA